MEELLSGARVVPEHPHHRACDGLATRLLNTSHHHAHVTRRDEGRGGREGRKGRGGEEGRGEHVLAEM